MLRKGFLQSPRPAARCTRKADLLLKNALTRRPLTSSVSPCSALQQIDIMPPYGSSSAQQPSPLRRFFDKVMRDERADFKPGTDGPKFLRAAVEIEPTDLLYRLTNPQELGAKRLKAALSCSDGTTFVRDHVLPFLKLLGCDALSRGTCKQPLIEVLNTIYQVPGLLQCLCKALETSGSTLGDVAPLGWLALNTALHVQGARQNEAIGRMAEALATHEGAAARAAAQIRVLLAPAQSTTASAQPMDVDGPADAAAESDAAFVAVDDLWQTAGGRHDNDHNDYREIQIMVTSQEAKCQHPPFLPRSNDSHLQLASCPEAALLDRQFRLLRADFVGPLTAELKRLGLADDSSNNPQASSQPDSASAGSSSAGGPGGSASPLQRPGSSSGSGGGDGWLSSAAASSRNVFHHPAIQGVAMKPRPCVMVSVALPSSHRAHRCKDNNERQEYWKQYGHGTLPLDALVCLASPGEPLVFATVVRRDTAELAAEHPHFGLAFEPGQQTERVLMRMGRGLLPNTVLVQVSTNFLSTRPVLQCLKDMVDVPLAEEVVHNKPSQPIDYLDKPALEQALEQLRPSFDPSQMDALEHALTSRLAIVQGPPGTGKTHCGVAMCDLILKHSSATLLVVCYTNHALDQFLEALLDKGITEIVRIGSRSKSKRLEQYNLRELDSKSRGLNLSIAENRRKSMLHSELETVEKRIMQLAALLTGPQSPPQASSSSSNGGGGVSGPAAPQGGAAAAAGGGRRSNNPADASAAATAAWQARNKQLQQQEEKARQERINRARQQGRGWAQDAGTSSNSSSARTFWEWPDAMQPYLDAEHPEVLKQLTIPAGMTKTYKDYLWKRWLSGCYDKGSVDTFEQQHSQQQQQPPPPSSSSAGKGSKKGAAAAGKKAEQQWVQVKPANSRQQPAAQPPLPEPLAAAAAAAKAGARVNVQALLEATEVPELLPKHLWDLPWPLRQQLASFWREQIRQQWAEELRELLQNKATTLQQELRSLQNSSYEALLKKARVIGCTTTGAALQKQLLTSRGVAPEVVMVEEAAEILEAHVLTSLSPETKHLIMIGDHRQLHPKVESYELSVQAGRGHSLNVSLFERLVEAGMPHKSLAVQHRMHPDISQLVKHTYPALQDHPSVHSRPPVKGLASRVVFVDHNVPELQEGSGAKWSAAFEHQSKVNKHEVDLACATVRYMLQQGYQPEQLVVLTPYLGQLLELNRQLSATVSVVLADLDIRDLRKAALPQALTDLGSNSSSSNGKSQDAAGGAPSSSGVRVATIDNYQGEEADIVVASLVRCNSAGKVGFLGEPERINVLMSRARQGLILIGSAHTLLNASNPNARKHWGVVLQQLQDAGRIYSGLPAVCQQHSSFRLPMLDSAAAFLEHAPDGGCNQPCMAVLPCGHTCKLRCHSYDREHARVRCEEPVYDLCSEGHLTTRLCSDTKTTCSTCVEIRLLQERERKEQQRLEQEAAKVRAAADKKKAQLAAQVNRLRSKLDDLAEQAAAKQEAIKLELQKQKMEKELELQKKRVAADLSAWEEAERQRAAEELQQMEIDEALQAEAEKQQAELEAEQKRLQKELAASSANLDKAQQQLEQQLQGIQNKKQRLEAEVTSNQGRAEAVARLQRSQLTSVVKLRADLLRLSQDGASCLPTIKQHLLDAADSPDTLDIVFEAAGLGAILSGYASALLDDQVSLPQLPKAAERGLSLLAKGELVDALQVFDSLLKTSTASNSSSSGSGSGPEDVQLLQALTELCQRKLGLPVGSSATMPPPAKKSRTATNRTAGFKSAHNHPVQHLLAALRKSADSTAAAANRMRQGLGVTNFREQRAADAAAAGHALAFLMHPAVYPQAGAAGDASAGSAAVSALHACLINKAWAVLGSKGKSAFSSTSVSPLLPEGSSSGKAGSSGQQELKARAKGSKVLLELLEMTGLEPVKQAMLNLADQVALDKQRGRDVNSSNYNVRFYGNPGTGKTTVARLYAKLLHELGVLPEGDIEETSGAELVAGGTAKLKEQLKKLEKGGVLFIDEAYQLDPIKSPLGQQVLNFLLPEMENKRGKLVVVLAGYRKPMEENIMAFNEGLPSRFPLVFTFPDYTDGQLLSIFDGILEGTKPVFKLSDAKYGRIATRRLGRQRDSGAPGFGNAREVRNLLESSISRQSARVIKEQSQGLSPDLLELQRDDLLGPMELDVSSSEPLRQLNSLTGLAKVKSSVSNLLGLIRTNAELEEQEKPLKDVCLNRVFLGNPGTGKTTVASIYGAILRDLGLLSKGDVLVKVPADFLGSVLGESEKKTMAILEEARGRVLVIDEAYGLHAGNKSRDPYKEAVIDTIVAKVQGVPGDDRCVLLLGYKEQMETMMREANPGLARRFQLSQAWEFEDYNKDQLLSILRDKAARSYGWQLDWPCIQAALSTLDKERRRPNFGNAGAINNLLSAAALRMESRCKDLSTKERAAALPAPVDFMSEEDAAVAAAGGASAASGVFADLIGCQSVLAKIKEWQATITASQKMGMDPLESFELNFLFVGSPGTGKTTVARRVGSLFMSLGILASDQVVECSAGDFVTGYVNQAAGKTREMFERALGGVLFIDEAYRLNPKIGGQFMSEVCDEICQILTDKQFKGKMVVVLAGYEAQIEELLTVNPGLKSRFSERLLFPDFSAADAIQLLTQQLAKRYSLELSKEAEERLPGLMQQLVEAPGWSNGRDVDTWVKRIFRSYSLRQLEGGSNDTDDVLAAVDLETSLTDFLASKKTTTSSSNMPPSTTSGLSPWEGIQLAPQFANAPPAPAVATDTATATAPSHPITVADVVMECTEEEEEQQQQPPVDTARGSGSFGNLPPEFLQDVQTALETLGYDLTSADAMQQLAGDGGLTERLLPLLTAGGTSSAVITERIRQWKQAIQEQLEMERQMKAKKQRPVWRCAVCGRYGCPVAPYIESYQEVDD